MATDQFRLLDSLGARSHPSDISSGRRSAVSQARLLGCGHRLSSLGSSTQSTLSFTETVVCTKRKKKRPTRGANEFVDYCQIFSLFMFSVFFFPPTFFFFYYVKCQTCCLALSILVFQHVALIFACDLVIKTKYFGNRRRRGAAKPNNNYMI